MMPVVRYAGIADSCRLGCVRLRVESPRPKGATATAARGSYLSLGDPFRGVRKIEMVIVGAFCASPAGGLGCQLSSTLR